MPFRPTRAVQVSLEDDGSPFRRLIDRVGTDNYVAEELLGMLRSISSKCFKRTLRPGDTGIDFALEAMLGIAANSKLAPTTRVSSSKQSKTGPGTSLVGGTACDEGSFCAEESGDVVGRRAALRPRPCAIYQAGHRASKFPLSLFALVKAELYSA